MDGVLGKHHIFMDVQGTGIIANKILKAILMRCTDFVPNALLIGHCCKPLMFACCLFRDFCEVDENAKIKDAKNV